MGIVEDLAELLNDTQADDLLASVGLKNQPILLPGKKGYRSAKRNIHFIRRHSIKPEIWIGKLHRGDEWISVYKKVGDSTWRFVEYPSSDNSSNPK